MKIHSRDFGKSKSGQKIQEYTLTNAQGVSLSVLNYGGVITRLMIPDRHGKLANVVLGYEDFESYEENSPYFGALIGRFANRIRNASFYLGNDLYTLSRNDGGHHLHGGFKGFDKAIWTVESEKSEHESRLILSYLSKDSEEGYPGNLNVTVTYSLDEHNKWSIDYHATSDKETIINLTQHSYFNLSGDFNREILDHCLHLELPFYLPVDSENLPLGRWSSVAGTPFDFSAPTTIGENLNKLMDQSHNVSGFDHCFAPESFGQSLRRVAQITHQDSGRHLEVFTTHPGVQFYTAHFPIDQYPNPQGGHYKSRTGFCLETQNFPDAPNQLNFPSAMLSPGEIYEHKTIFKFRTD
jgi:aldose 1-epimerase